MQTPQGTTVGPMSVHDLISNGLTHNTYVWTAGMPEWLRASQVPELAQALAGSVPPPPGNPSQPQYAPGYQQPYQQPYRQPYQQGYGVPSAKPDNYLVWAIVTTVLCCLPAGVVSIIYANKVDRLWREGDFAGADSASKQARTWAIVSAVLGVVVGIIYFCFGLLGALN